MCGLAGFVDVYGTQDDGRARLHAMLARIAHRGPDDEGLWQEGPVAIGHRRLSIIDLSPLGHQPMLSASGRYVIALNGEIYNHRMLRSALESRGVIFRGRSDTEVLLALIEREGLVGALKQCIGMFAMVLWDRRDRILQLARDRFGEKPLYYGWHAGGFIWGSELKALCAHERFERRLNEHAVGDVLRYGYVPGPASIFQQTFKLPPAHVLSLEIPEDAAGPLTETRCRMRTEPFWSADECVERGLSRPFEGSYGEAADLLDAALAEAVSLQMQADVPLGAFLSGGVDSSLVVALLQARSTSPVRSFSIGFDDASLDEAPAARAIAARLGTVHAEHYVSVDEVVSTVARLPEIFCEPVADPSQIPTFLVSQLARRSVTVSLSGDGGDETFGGYPKYLFGQRVNALRMRRVLGLLARSVPSPLLSAAWRLARPRTPAPVRERAIRLWRNLLPSPTAAAIAEALSAVNLDHNAVTVRDLRTTELASRVPKGRSTRAYPRTAMNLDLAAYLPDDILTKVDRASMAASLESRAPLLDHRIFELTARFPMPFLFDGRGGKRILREVLMRHVPASLIERPKSGFTPPLGRWLRGPLFAWAADTLASARTPVADLLDLNAARTLLERNKREEGGDQALQLWPVLTLVAWSARNLATSE